MSQGDLKTCHSTETDLLRLFNYVLVQLIQGPLLCLGL